MSRKLALVTAALVSLWCLCPAMAESRRGELRGAWTGEGYGRDWPAVMRSLKDNGFNAIFPNFSIGNMAFYPSKVLAVAPGGDAARNELAEAVKSAKANGIELHVWRINWALWQTPEELLAQLGAAGRLQRNSKGQRGKEDPDIGVDWLCPSNPENRKLEKEAMLELVRGYDIAGIQFDYMRYPGGDYCFCDGCKGRFQQSQGVNVEKWPEDVREGGRLAGSWQQWRRGLITSLAQEISDAAHALKPDISVSLAAWPDIDAGRDVYGQDWVPWAREGTLDFVCPMDYTIDDQALAEMVERQVAAARGAVPLYAGLGAFEMQSSGQLIDQVEVARAEGADGFVAFAYGSGDLEKWLPELRAGVTSQDPGPMPHAGPPVRFALSGEATQPPATGRNVVAGKKLEVEVALGWEPPKPAEGAEADAQAGAMLDRVLNQRTPINDYESRGQVLVEPGEAERVAGRIVVEAATGAPLQVLGAFDSEWRFERKLTFTAPEGPFRLTVYGAVTDPKGKREFVVRAPLRVGVNL
ncbi:MAG: glycoside hydrolase family 10 protein [Armatimonadota bacterium]